MKELLELIIKSIVDSPGKISITKEPGDLVKFTVTAPSDQIGVIIGQQGRTIKAIKNLLSVVAKGSRFIVQVEEAE